MKTKTSKQQSIPLPDYGLWLHHDNGPEKYMIRGAMLAKWPPRHNELILDVGTGRGIIGIGYAKQNPSVRVVGLDIWQADSIQDNSPVWVLENARRENVGARLRCVTARAECLPFKQSAFDRVVSSFCLQNIENPELQFRAFAEVVRVLRPGGLFIYADAQRDKPWAQIHGWLAKLHMTILDDDHILLCQSSDYYVGFLCARKKRIRQQTRSRS